MNNIDHLEQDLVKLVKQQGEIETPAYIYSIEKVENNYNKLITTIRQ